MPHAIDIIDPQIAPTIPALFRERAGRTPQGCAYRTFFTDGGCCEIVTWAETEALAARWQAALGKEGLKPGDRVAVMLRNSLEWVLFDLAALGLGLVTVPLFVKDRPENFAFILEETGARLILIEGMEQWQAIQEVGGRLSTITRIVTLNRVCEKDCDPRLAELAAWLPESGNGYSVCDSPPDELATIVYTSGTTGVSKGVMLSHANILENASSGLRRVPVYTDDLFLSFLPLSHTFERTVGYYASMMAGACVAHVRSIDTLPEDLTMVHPTVLISVPRIFERINKKIIQGLSGKPALVRSLFYLAVNCGWKKFLHSQGRGPWTPLFLIWPLLKRLVADRVMAGLGGRVRMAISGGAPLAPPVARIFIGLGLNLLQGYGLTETSPVVSVNSAAKNLPATVGPPLAGVEVSLSEAGELLVRGPNVMLGYWQNKTATEAVIDSSGWLHTGDLARIDADGHITITGRLKEIIVLSTGEKVPPEELQLAITVNPLFEQALVVGEGRPYLAALVVLNDREWEKLAIGLGIPPERSELINSERVEKVLLGEIARRIARFPGYAQIRRVHATLTPWQIQEGLITATLKLRRRELLARFAREVEGLYAGH